MNGDKSHTTNDSFRVDDNNGEDSPASTSSGTTTTAGVSESQSQWIGEGAAVIADISSCVVTAILSDSLTSKDSKAPCAYINIETLESRQVCVKLSAGGFSVVGHKFDDKSLEDDQAIITFETPYSLLQSISPLYGNKFATQLYEKLLKLSKQS